MKHINLFTIAVALFAAASLNAQAPMESAKPMATPPAGCICKAGMCGCGADCAPGKCPKAMKCACPEGCMKDGKCMKGCAQKCATKEMKCNKGKMMACCEKCGKQAKKCCCAKMDSKMKGECPKMGKAMGESCEMGKEKKSNRSHKRFHRQAFRK